MDNLESRATRGPSSPHSYSTPPFARTNLSSAAATSLLHRRGLRAHGPSQHLGPVSMSTAAPSTKLFKTTAGSGSSGSASQDSSSDETRVRHAKIHPSGGGSGSSYEDKGAGNGSSGGGSSSSSVSSSAPPIKWDPKNPSINDKAGAGVLPVTMIKDEKQAKKNDMILQERLMEAKAINPKAASGAVVHKFSLWNGLKNKGTPPTVSTASASAAASATTATTASAANPFATMTASAAAAGPGASAFSSMAAPLQDVFQLATSSFSSNSLFVDENVAVVSSSIPEVMVRAAKVRGPKAVIDKQSSLDFDTLASKVAAVDLNPPGNLQTQTGSSGSSNGSGSNGSGSSSSGSTSSSSKRTVTPVRILQPKAEPERRYSSSMETPPSSNDDSKSSSVERLGKSSSGRGLTSSLRSKVDSAAKANLPQDPSLLANDFLPPNHKRLSINSSTDLRGSRDGKLGIFSPSIAEYEDINMGSYKDEDVDDDCVSMGSIEEDEELRIRSRPSSEPIMTDEKILSAGRPPLPGIRHQSIPDFHPNGNHNSGGGGSGGGNGSGSGSSASSKSRSKHRSSHDEKSTTMPPMIKSMTSIVPPLMGLLPSTAVAIDSDSDLSPTHGSGNGSSSSHAHGLTTPPPLTKAKSRQYSEDKPREKVDQNSREFSSAPGSPITSPRMDFHHTPKIAFRSRQSSITSPPPPNGILAVSGSASSSGYASRQSRDESPSLTFAPIRDSLPESRSHSIFVPNARDFSNSLSLTLQSIDSVDNSSSSWNRSRSDSNGSSVLASSGYGPTGSSHHYGMPGSVGGASDNSFTMQDSSPDYSRDPFDSPSPTLSVMTHMSDHDISDRYEQLVFSKSSVPTAAEKAAGATDGSSMPSRRASNETVQGAAAVLAADAAAAEKAAVASFVAAAIGSRGADVFDGKTVDRTPRDRYSQQQQQQLQLQLFPLQPPQAQMQQSLDPYGNNDPPFSSGTFRDEDRNGYSEVLYIGADGEQVLRWKKGQPIGEGTFGRVYKGLNESTGELAAVKQLSIGNGTEAEIDNIKREIRVMWQLNHENIVRYLGTSRSNRYLFIVLEFVSGGSIASMLLQFGAFSESLIRKFSCHIMCGVDYLHQKGIIHRDIKGANVLVTDTGVAKIADFGCSKQLAGLCTTSLEESLRTIRGSVPWMAPEVIKQSGHGRSSDIWSIGATVIEMATGRPPWSEFTNNLAALFHVATSKEPPPVPSHLSRSCAQFLTKCMMVDPSQRATAQELLTKDEFLVSELEQQKRTKSF